MKVEYDQGLDAAAFAFKMLYAGFPGAPLVLRLQVDFCDADGNDRNMDLLANVPRGITTEQLVERIRGDLAPGCTLSTIGALDYNGFFYLAPGFIERTLIEQGLNVPDDIEVTLDAIGCKMLRLEELE